MPSKMRRTRFACANVWSMLCEIMTITSASATKRAHDVSEPSNAASPNFIPAARLVEKVHAEIKAERKT